MTYRNDYIGPKPSVGFEKQVTRDITIPLTDLISGELIADSREVILGPALKDVVIVNAGFSIYSGKDDSNALRVSGEILSEGSSIFTTVPRIQHISGEAAQWKTTAKEMDGVQVGVINPEKREIKQGQCLVGRFYLTRSSTPATEMRHPSFFVEIE